jgi:hypothetical protein
MLSMDDITNLRHSTRGQRLGQAALLLAILGAVLGVWWHLAATHVEIIHPSDCSRYIGRAQHGYDQASSLLRWSLYGYVCGVIAAVVATCLISGKLRWIAAGVLVFSIVALPVWLVAAIRIIPCWE